MVDSDGDGKERTSIGGVLPNEIDGQSLLYLSFAQLPTDAQAKSFTEVVQSKCNAASKADLVTPAIGHVSGKKWRSAQKPVLPCGRLLNL
jgi:hypothetical protein